MPSRPRSHRLEEESHEALSVALGERFVYRRENPDYGIDGEVEEFDAADKATGLRFYVQVKATDKRPAPNSLKVSLDLETAAHYRALPLPVLMVRYSSPARRIFARWFHQFDPYYGGLTENALTFRWQPTDLMGDTTPGRLADEARAFFALRSANLKLPLPIYLAVRPDGCWGLSPAELLFALRGEAERRRDLVAVEAGDAPPGSTRTIVRPDLCSVNLAEVTTATVHLSNYRPGVHGEQFGADAMTLLGLALAHVGHADLASRMAATYLPRSSLVGAPEVAWALSSSLARARRVREALDLADDLDNGDEASRQDASFMFTLPALLHADGLDHREQEAYISTFESRIARRAERGDSLESARAAYTLANFFRARARPAEALQRYDEALEHDPGYEVRGYYWKERAGVLFGSHNYPAAADAYRRARELDEDEDCVALAADADMWAGRYAQARDEFARYNQQPRELGELWRLKQAFLNVVVDQFGTSSDVRDVEGARALYAGIPDVEPRGSQAIEQLAEQLERVLELDGLFGPAWFNLGWAHTELENSNGALVDYLAAALTLETDAGAWVNAVALALQVGPHLVSDLIRSGARMAGGSFRTQVVDFARSQGDQFPVDDFLTAIDAELQSGRPTGVEVTLRHIARDGTVSATQLSGTGSSNGSEGSDTA